MRGSAGVDPTDEQLLTRSASDPDAFEALYRKHVGKTVAFAVRRCRTAEEVHDLVAAIWLEVIGAAARFDPERGGALAWIYGVGMNLVADGRRREARETEALRRLGGHRMLAADDVERLDEAMDASRQLRAVLDEVERLPPAERAALEAVALDGLSAEEAAHVLGIESAAIRMRVSRARRKLRAADLDAKETGS